MSLRDNVLITARAFGGRIDKYGDGANEEIIEELVEEGLLVLERDGDNPTYELTSMGVQAARKAEFAQRKK
jgi:hypothetical protein